MISAYIKHRLVEVGAEVTLFTRSPGKEADARRLGTHHIVLSTVKAQTAAAARCFYFAHRYRALCA